MNLARSRQNNLQYSLSRILWLLFFCFATSAALLFQKFLLPMFPSLHAGYGLLDGDSIYFHSVAVELAEKIRLYGWHSWSMVPGNAATGNVAILGALYAIFGVDPSLIVPINAAVHALSGVVIFRIGKLLAPGKIGRIAGICAAVLFVCFPSALNWYGQVHKDGFAIAGTLIMIYTWLWARARPGNFHTIAHAGLGTVAAVLLIGFVRPYNLIPLFVVMTIVFVGTLAANKIPPATNAKIYGALSLSLVILFAGAVWAKYSGASDGYTYDPKIWAAELGNWTWKRSTWMPPALEDYVESTARTRVRSIPVGIRYGAGSMIDTDVKPDDLVTVAAYAPRALQIALFAPFPSTWFEKSSPTRLVSIFETLVWYVLAPGVILALYFRRSGQLLTALCFAALFLYIYGFAITNVGTLYRIRYPFLFLFVLAGLIGWLELLYRRHWWFFSPGSLSTTTPAEFVTPPPGAVADKSRKQLLGAGIWVTFFSGVGYLGLFFRDILLARWFGTGSALDSFFVATAIPMFLVSIMSIPIGTMLVPQFLTARDQRSPAAAQQLVSKIAFIYLCVVLAVAGAFWLGSAPLLRAITADFGAEKLGMSVTIFRWMLAVLIFSGFVIMNNALLNVLGRYTVPSAAQIAVPVASILALYAFGDEFGVHAVVGGLVVGQIINLWLVGRVLRKCGFSVWPRWTNSGVPVSNALAQYLPLVAAALFVNIAMPVNMGMASTLVEGSAAILGLGNKIVTLTSGLVAAAIVTVILPHFASLMARNRLLDARNELSFFLLAATFITIPVTLAMFEAADPLVRLVFKGGAFDDAAVQSVAKVMRYGIIQLPFFTVNLLMLKFAIAGRRAGKVMLASLVALGVNVVLNLLLMTKSGVAGIALATSLATATSSCFMLLIFHRLGHISWVNLIMIALNWLLYTTLVICLQYESYPGVMVSLLALVVLLAGQWNILARWRVAA
jgi:murein biosynthesis integral membrane protein MurJ